MRRTAPLLALLLAHAVITFPFVYREGCGDADACVVAATLTHGVRTPDAPADDALAYQWRTQSLYYSGARSLLAWLSVAPESVPAALNWASWLISLGTTALLYGFVLRLGGPIAAMGAGALWVLSPVVWHASLYQHPVVPALAASLLCAWILSTGKAEESYPALFGRSILAGMVGAVALGTRLEAAIILPGLCIGAALRRGRGGGWIRGAALCATAGATAGLLYIFLAPPSLKPGGFVVGLLGTFWIPAAIPYGLSNLLRSVGPAALITLGIWFLEGRRWGPLQITGVVIGLPSVAFWLGNPSMVRHFLVPAMGLAIFAGKSLADRFKGIRLAAAAGLIALVNVLTPEALWLVERGALGLERRGSHARSLYDEAIALDAEGAARVGAFRDLLEESPGDLVIYGNWQHLGPLMIAAAAREAGPTSHLYVRQAEAFRLEGPHRDVWFILRFLWKNDVVNDVAADPRWEGARHVAIPVEEPDLVPHAEPLPPGVELLGAGGRG